ncbi:MAG: sleB [Bacilli bacterium]|nr:sleB [Bacilli bacterium]
MLKLLITLLAGTIFLVGFSYNQNHKTEEISSLIEPKSLSNKEIKFLELFVNAEGKSEPYIVKVAIASVILNRLKDSNFPKSVDAIIFQPGEFSSINNGKIWSIMLDDSGRRAVADAISGADPTEGSVFYYNPHTAKKPNKYTPVKQIGSYIFCK